MCIPLSNQTISLCGSGGNVCTACNVGQLCVNGSCQSMTMGQPIGGPCTSAAQCQTGLSCKMTTARGDAVMPQGYCTRSCTGPNDTTSCGSNARCVGGPESNLQFFGETTPFCAATCPSGGGQSTCRADYWCLGEQGAPGACWLANFPPFDGGGQATKTGQPCTTDSQCTNPPHPQFGFCFPPTDPNTGSATGWTSGYCTADCLFDNTGTFCGPNAVCIVFGQAPNTDSLCVATCTTAGSQSNCRTGYVCRPVTGLTGGICMPRCDAPGGGCASGRTCNTTTGLCQ
jgi:hypothetical protein